MKFKNKIAIVTGASTGIGQAVAVEMAKEGAFVYLVARNIKGLLETKTLIKKVGGNADALVADLSSVEKINNLIEEIKAKTDRVNILANIAGVWHGKDEVYADTAYESFDQQIILDTFMVGTIAPSLMTHALIPLMPKNGKIINLSGTFENGAKGWLPYFVSKKAIEDLTIGLAEELEDKEIQVNCISPSDTATKAYQKFFPQYMDEAIEPKKIAQQAVYLCSDDANKVTGKVFVMKKGKEPCEGYHS
jgi:NAD(P)-dependent dehydrogenase (short-subunit alcohol dehydrogenase family)